jgi:Tfp pilus assembly PilM family ATPase
MFRKRQIFPIGVDIGTEILKVAQLGSDSKGVFIVAAAWQKVPAGLEVGSSSWQRWAAEALKQLTCNGIFCGKEAVAGLPAGELFIEPVKILNRPGQKLEEAVLASVREKLSLRADDAMVKYVVAAESAQEDWTPAGPVREGRPNSCLSVLVMATERLKVERYLAIYEAAKLDVKQIGVWPLAMVKSYVTFFGRRQQDQDKIAMLVQIGANHTHVDICRGDKLLFARLVPMGLKKLNGVEMANKLILELSACEHYFESICGMNRVEKLVYLSGKNSDKSICDNLAQLAQRRRIPAQLGDVLGAVGVRPGVSKGFDRRSCRVDWAIAFGLSLSGAT